MDLRQMRYFLAVAEAKSFVSAASNLYISRQGISRSIGQLEEELGLELFQRDSNGSLLTPAGQFFYDRVRSILLDVDGLKSEMQGYQAKNHRRIRMAFSVGAMQLYESRLLDYIYHQNLADMDYQEVPEAEISGLLLDRKCEIAISSSEPRDPLISCQELIRSPYGILLQDRDSVAELHSVDLKDLSWLPLAAYCDAQTLDFCEKHRLTIRYPGYDYLRMFGLVATGKCALVLPLCLIPPIPGFRWLPLETPDCWILTLAYPKSLENDGILQSALDPLKAEVFQPALQDALGYAKQKEAVQ